MCARSVDGLLFKGTVKPYCPSYLIGVCIGLGVFPRLAKSVFFSDHSFSSDQSNPEKVLAC